MFKTALTIIISLFYLASNAQSLFSISGVVKDKSGILPGATVFLSSTKSITSTDNKGAFKLKGISPGTYLLVAKFIGYQTTTIAINIIDKSIDINLALKENANQLSQVTITADPKWEEHFKEFKRRFIGETPNSKYCKIENKEALHFKYTAAAHILAANADEFLKIRNDALGYNISYALESFEFNFKTGVLRYQGYPSFQELKPKDNKQKDLWEKNRAIAFAGSPTHFMKALFDGSSYKQGFRVFSCDYDALNPLTDEGLEKPIQVFTKEQVFLDTLIDKTNQDFKILAFKRSLFIAYINAKEAFDYKNSGYEFTKPLGISMIPRGQLSIISLLENDVAIDNKGNFSPPDALLFKGYMAWRQVADLTPIEYIYVP